MGRTLVVLNAMAGLVQDLGAEPIRRQVDAALTTAEQDVEVRVLAPQEMGDAIAATQGEGFDTLIVGAGDGTVSHAAALLCGSQVRLGVLPLGTMNMLAYDIGLPRDLPGALAALRAASPRRIDLGLLNGRAFHGVSGLGFFSQMAMARESYRTSHGRITGWLLALAQAALRTGRHAVEVEVEGARAPIDAYAVLVTNNAFDAPGWHRGRLDGGQLEVHIAEERGALARIRAGADVLIEAWRDNPGIHSFRASALTIHARRRHRAWVATDGEVTREEFPLRYRIAPRALTLLLPPGALQARADAAAPGGGAPPA